MKRTQIYIDDELHRILIMESKHKRKRMSNLIREALREKYMNQEKRLHRLDSIVGIWKDRSFNVDKFIRDLRKDNRRKRIYE
ncbi:MAG: CopG family transcriptional regulator [Bacteroidota bacterium]